MSPGQGADSPGRLRRDSLLEIETPGRSRGDDLLRIGSLGRLRRDNLLGPLGWSVGVLKVSSVTSAR